MTITNVPDAMPWSADRASAHYGDNVRRLPQVKHRYDPDNWFSFTDIWSLATENE